MAPKNRKDNPENLPLNLHRDGAYLRYWNSEKKKYKHLGRCDPTDRDYRTKLSKAIEAATIANLKIESRRHSFDIFAESNKTKFNDTISLYEPQALAKVGAKNTKQRISKRLEKIAIVFGDMTPDQITTKMLTDFIEPMTYGVQKTMKQELKAIFAYALSIGHRELTLLNPAEVLLLKEKPAKKRQRLSLDCYRAVYAVAPEWLQVAMNIMLHTTLRPVDVVQLKYSDFDGVYIRTIISKSKRVDKPGKHLAIELNSEEQQIIIDSKNNILSPYIVHRLPGRKSAKGSDKNHYTQLTVDYISREFSRIRDKLELYPDLEPDQKPSLYEVRALASDLYKVADRPKEEIQALMAHTDGKTTDIYLEGHRVEYEQVKAGLNIKNI